MPFVDVIHHEQLGTVVVSVRRNSSRLTARWKSGVVNLNVPYGVGIKEIDRFLDDFTPQILEKRPAVKFCVGMKIRIAEGMTIEISSQSIEPLTVLGQITPRGGIVAVGSELPFDDPMVMKRINSMILKVARNHASSILLPHARKVATRLGAHPTGWNISKGHRTLGQCDMHGVISLSYVLLFLPEDLREYVICHELAHLLEMNHSSRFHALLDSYLDGQEAALTARLRRYSWPILRN